MTHRSNGKLKFFEVFSKLYMLVAVGTSSAHIFNINTRNLECNLPARNLPPIERAELIEHLLESFNDDSQKKINERQAKEAESRIDAYNAGLCC